MSLVHIINPAGGAYYHFLALKYKNGLWKDFIEENHHFLDSWKPSEKNLVIFGSSGGYCLKSSFLNKFENIVLVDPDPLAKLLFSINHKKIRLSHNKKNYLQDGLRGLQSLIQSYPSHAFLFSNIIGQIPFLIKSQTYQVSELQHFLFTCLNKNSWASFHDLYSFHFKQVPQGLCWPLILQGRSLQDYVHSLRVQTQLRPQQIETIDHQTHEIFSRCEFQFRSIWKRTPSSHHIVDGYLQNC